MSEENSDVSPKNPIVNLLGLLVYLIVFVSRDTDCSKHGYCKCELDRQRP